MVTVVIALGSNLGDRRYHLLRALDALREVVHVVTGLESGGAERMLERLVTSSDRSRVHHAVIALGRFQPSPTRAFIEYILEHRERLQEAARPF